MRMEVIVWSEEQLERQVKAIELFTEGLHKRCIRVDAVQSIVFDESMRGVLSQSQLTHALITPITRELYLNGENCQRICLVACSYSVWPLIHSLACMMQY